MLPATINGFIQDEVKSKFQFNIICKLSFIQTIYRIEKMV